MTFFVFFSQARVEKIPKQERQFEWIALVQECILSRQYSWILASSPPLGRHHHSIRHEDPLCPRREYFNVTRCLAFRQFYLLRGCVIFEGEREDGQGLGQWTRGCRWRDAVSLTRKCSEIDRLDRGSIDRFGWLAQLADANFDVVRWINKTA